MRHFYCSDVLWETFEQMANDFDCSIDYLVNEAMRYYARSKNYQSPGGPQMTGQHPPAVRGEPEQPPNVYPARPGAGGAGPAADAASRRPAAAWAAAAVARLARRPAPDPRLPAPRTRRPSPAPPTGGMAAQHRPRRSGARAEPDAADGLGGPTLFLIYTASATR